MDNKRYSHNLQTTVFNVILIYYWFMLNTAHWYLGGDKVSVEVGSVVYWALVLPIFIFVVSMGVKHVIRKDVIWLLLFGVFIFFGALVKGDLSSAKSFLFLALTVGVIIGNRLSMSPSLLNVLYLLSVVWCVLLTMLGINKYGFIPGGSPDEYAGLGYRISLFPYSVVGSALFSLVVVVANVFGRASRLRPLVILIALYFILLSANRSVLICLLLIPLFLLFQHIVKFSDRALYRWLIPLVLVCFIMSLGLLPFLATSESLMGSKLGATIFHGDVNEYALGNLDRLSIWLSHWNAWLSSPIFGVLPQDIVVEHNDVAVTFGSESFLTGVAAQTGMGVVFLILFFRAAVRRTLVEVNARGYVMLMMIAVLSISYGSFMGPTEFTFLAMISIVSGVAPRTSRGEVQKHQITDLQAPPSAGARTTSCNA